MPASGEGPTVRRRRLGMELRALREAVGLNSQQAAEELGCSQSKISRVENGKTPVSVRDVRDLLVLYRVTDEQQRERLLSLARESRQRGWWAEFGPWLPSGFDTYAGMEAATASVRAYQAQLVHGLLQTEDYARALLSALRVEDTRNTVEKLVDFRMTRQAQLTRAGTPLRLWVILEEEVLKRPSAVALSCRLNYSASWSRPRTRRLRFRYCRRRAERMPGWMAPSHSLSSQIPAIRTLPTSEVRSALSSLRSSRTSRGSPSGLTICGQLLWT